MHMNMYVSTRICMYICVMFMCIYPSCIGLLMAAHILCCGGKLIYIHVYIHIYSYNVYIYRCEYAPTDGGALG